MRIEAVDEKTDNRPNKISSLLVIHVNHLLHDEDYFLRGKVCPTILNKIFSITPCKVYVLGKYFDSLRFISNFSFALIFDSAKIIYRILAYHILSLRSVFIGIELRISYLFFHVKKKRRERARDGQGSVTGVLW